MFASENETSRRERDEWRYEFAFDFEFHDPVFAARFAYDRVAHECLFDVLRTLAEAFDDDLFALVRIQFNTIRQDFKCGFWRCLQKFEKRKKF